MIKSLGYNVLKSPKLIFGLFLIAFFSGCSQNPEDDAKSLVRSSIKAHGGQHAYAALQAISFKKTTRLFLEDGSLESEVVQQQSFQLKPDYRVQINWKHKDNNHVIFYDGKKVIKTINGEVIKDSLEIFKAEKAAKAASYVFFQPFELLSDNTILTLEDATVLNDSTTAQTMNVAYKNDEKDADMWTYYFNDEDLLIANSVILKDHHSLIENLEFQTVSGLVFNKHRKSYRVDRKLNKKYLRAEYFYENIKAQNKSKKN